VRVAPLVEASPGAKVLADRVEAFLHLGPNSPVAMAAIALLVDGGRFVAADALLPHDGGTEGAVLWLRLVAVLGFALR
jgi:hypothetical protein